MEPGSVEEVKEEFGSVEIPIMLDNGSTIDQYSITRRRTNGPTKRSTKGNWTEEEDAILMQAVKQFNGKNWKQIAKCFNDRADVQCLHRWQKVLNPDVVKGPWTKEEDDEIVKQVEKLGTKKWSVVAQSLPGRIGKQCRERWYNQLNPAIKKEPWTQEEDCVLIHAHQIYGNKWAEIAKFIPGRTDNSIKNYWNCTMKKKLQKQSNVTPLLSTSSLSTAGEGLDRSIILANENSECSAVTSGQNLGSEVCPETSSVNLSLLSANQEVKPNYNEVHESLKEKTDDNSVGPDLGLFSRCEGNNSRRVSSESTDNENSTRDEVSLTLSLGSLDYTPGPLRNSCISSVNDDQSSSYSNSIPSLLNSRGTMPSVTSHFLSSNLDNVSPEDILENAARSFTCTPSIMRKRPLEICAKDETPGSGLRINDIGRLRKKLFLSPQYRSKSTCAVPVESADENILDCKFQLREGNASCIYNCSYTKRDSLNASLHGCAVPDLDESLTTKNGLKSISKDHE
ncbi:hypothetical protein AMTRI_Chr07g31150 [Amborella trichopoda]